jgi:DNA-binding PadR family transcriptional regulator
MARGSEGLGREIVLALLVERPGNAYELDQRLRRRFPNAGYARDTARKSLKRLEADGLVAPIDAAQSRRRSRAVSREATPAGVAQAQKWVGDYITMPPLREELYARIVLCDADSVPRLLSVAREAERMCELQLGRLDGDDRDAGKPPGSGTIAGDVEKSWWDSRFRYLQSVRCRLQDQRKWALASAPPVG